MKNILKKIIFIIALLTMLAVVTLFLIEKKNPVKEPSANVPFQQVEDPMANEAPPTPNQTTVDINDSSKNTPLPGKQTDNPDISSKFGKYAFEAFQKNSDLAEKIKTIDNNFDPSQMGTSFPSHTYLLDNGKEYLALGGCTPHDCAGTEKVVIYSVKSGSLFGAAENRAQTQLRISGNPDESEKNLLMYYYFHN